MSRPRRARTTLVLLALCAGSMAGPTSANAQFTAFVAGPAVSFDTDFSPSTKAAPGVFVDGWLHADRTVSWGATAGYARSDFPVGADELHRHHGWVVFAGRARTSATDSGIGVSFGVGALAWDDISESDPAFRSSADLEALIVPGLEVHLGGTESLRIVAHVRDQITGWFDAFLDPEEGALQHRIVIGVGVEFQ